MCIKIGSTTNNIRESSSTSAIKYARPSAELVNKKRILETLGHKLTWGTRRHEYFRRSCDCTHLLMNNSFASSGRALRIKSALQNCEFISRPSGNLLRSWTITRQSFSQLIPLKLHQTWNLLTPDL